MTRRARRRSIGGCLGPVVAALLVVGAVIGGLVWWDWQRPVRGQCYATLPDGTVQVLDGEQTDNAALFAAIAEHRGLPARATTIAIATGMQESKLSNIDYGDRDSVGLFQQRPSQGWGTVEQIMDPVYSTNAFFDVLVQVEGWESDEITDAAQKVQRSAFPTAYAQHESVARAFASALTGHSKASLTCSLGKVDEGAAAVPRTVLTAVDARVQRDFVSLPTRVTEGGALMIDAVTLPSGSDTSRASWSVAQWAVGTASATNASVVAVGDLVWLREEAHESDKSSVEENGAGADWRALADFADDPRVAPLAGDLTGGVVPAGTVLVR